MSKDKFLKWILFFVLTISVKTMNAQIDEAYQKKYSSSPYLSPMISSGARAATVKIIPK